MTLVYDSYLWLLSMTIVFNYCLWLLSKTIVYDSFIWLLSITVVYYMLSMTNYFDYGLWVLSMTNYYSTIIDYVYRYEYVSMVKVTEPLHRIARYRPTRVGLAPGTGSAPGRRNTVWIIIRPFLRAGFNTTTESVDSRNCLELMIRRYSEIVKLPWTSILCRYGPDRR